MGTSDMPPTRVYPAHVVEAKLVTIRRRLKPQHIPKSYNVRMAARVAASVVVNVTRFTEVGGSLPERAPRQFLSDHRRNDFD